MGKPKDFGLAYFGVMGPGLGLIQYVICQSFAGSTGSSLGQVGGRALVLTRSGAQSA